MNESVLQHRQAVRSAIAARDYARAGAHLQQILAIDKGDVAGWLNLAAVHRQLGKLDDAYLALREVLRIDPRHFHALLMSASLLEQQGNLQAAAAGYGVAAAAAPADHSLDAPTRQALERGRALHAKFTNEQRDFVHAAVAQTKSQCGAAVQRRLDAFIDTSLRLRKRYQQQPMDFFYAGLPTIEFYDRELFPWLPELEAATPVMQAELSAILREDERELTPYVQYADHLPLDQWRELNHSPRWSAYHFYESGRPKADHCERAPQTFAAITRLPQAQVPLRSPTALFSVLQPQTHIPAHHGVANFRLLVHMPLVLPSNCRFRVGGETREWRIGEAWVFDDTIEHEAWNDSDRVRVILICDIWHPALSPEERDVIANVLGSMDTFTGTKPAPQF